MAQRLDLQTLFLTFVPNVYFQAAPNVKMVYPCIVYSRDSARVEFADDIRYKHHKRYQVTVIDADPDSELPDKVAALPFCTFDRFFSADNLNHDVFRLYF